MMEQTILVKTIKWWVVGERVLHNPGERSLTHFSEIKEDFSLEIISKLRSKDERIYVGKEVGIL